jgi:hypothetical protein
MAGLQGLDVSAVHVLQLRCPASELGLKKMVTWPAAAAVHHLDMFHHPRC